MVQGVFLRVVTPCNLRGGYQRTGELHLQGRSNGSYYDAFRMAHLHPSYLGTDNGYSNFLPNILIYSGITRYMGEGGGAG